MNADPVSLQSGASIACGPGGETRVHLSRREFLVLSTAAVAGTLTGCATNPVTGRSQLMFYTKDSELEWDRKYSPHQHSADYGSVQDAQLNAYIEGIGKQLATSSHRPDMPFSFRCVNASYINAYAFPAGHIATTRGILVMMEDESQLAALLGHEITHVCARHTAQQMTKNLMMMGAIAGAYMLAERHDEDLVPWVIGLGYIGMGLLLCKYSRENEREADDIGLRYAVQNGYNPKGMSGLMDGFRKLAKKRPNLLERLFSSHPMSEDRYQIALQRATVRHAAQLGVPTNRERYMDMTAGVRRLQPAIDAIQKGDEALEDEDWTAARAHYADALRVAPNDYEALLKMANWHLVRDQPREAVAHVTAARSVYPEEPQALHMKGMTEVRTAQFDAALDSFVRYEAMLPGNPFSLFYIGRSHEGMSHRTDAGDHYQRFLKEGGEGSEAEHARMRLKQWGMALPTATA